MDGFFGKSVRENALRGGIMGESIVKKDDSPEINETKPPGLSAL